MATPHRPRAVIYIPSSENTDRLIALCLDYCEQQRYRLVSVVTDDPDQDKWRQINTMLMSGRIEVIVVPHRTDLPPNRVPRIEAVDDEPRPRRVQRQRRPRRTDR